MVDDEPARRPFNGQAAVGVGLGQTSAKQLRDQRPGAPGDLVRGGAHRIDHHVGGEIGLRADVEPVRCRRSDVADPAPELELSGFDQVQQPLGVARWHRAAQAHNGAEVTGHRAGGPARAARARHPDRCRGTGVDAGERFGGGVGVGDESWCAIQAVPVVRLAPADGKDRVIDEVADTGSGADLDPPGDLVRTGDRVLHLLHPPSAASQDGDGRPGTVLQVVPVQRPRGVVGATARIGFGVRAASPRVLGKPTAVVVGVCGAHRHLLWWCVDLHGRGVLLVGTPAPPLVRALEDRDRSAQSR